MTFHRDRGDANDARMTIYHPIDDGDKAVVSEQREMLVKSGKPQFAPEGRGAYDAVMRHTPMPSGVEFEADVVGGVRGEWCYPHLVRGSTAILFLHGGGYVMGSPAGYRAFAGQIVARSKTAAFIPDYRLAPEHPFPAAIEDAVTAYRALPARGFTAIGLSGDSSGGGLALALLTYLAFTSAGGDIRPSGAAVFSPMTDLALTGASMTNKANADPILSGDSLSKAVSTYLAGHNARDPLASPLYGVRPGLPPVHLDVGEDEVLLDDSIRYADRAEQDGVECALNVWLGMPHGFVSNVSAFRAAGAALDGAAAFLAEKIGRNPS
jgi:monoterpene epsilon-lactone hydrolase